MPALRFFTLIVFLSPANGARRHPWSDRLSANAAREGKLVLLDMEGVWCH